MHRYLSANLLRVGYFELFSFHHSSGFFSVESSPIYRASSILAFSHAGTESCWFCGVGLITSSKASLACLLHSDALLEEAHTHQGSQNQ